MRKTHISASLIISVLSLVFLLWLIPTQTSPPDSHLDLAPKFMPTLAITVCLGLAVLMGLTAFFSRKKDGELHEEFGEEASGMGWPEFQKLDLDICVGRCLVGHGLCGLRTRDDRVSRGGYDLCRNA